MVTVNVALPDSLKDWVDSQIERGIYADASDYLRDLIRRDQQRNEALADALEDGLASGTVDYSIDEIWHRAKAKAIQMKPTGA